MQLFEVKLVKKDKTMKNQTNKRRKALEPPKWIRSKKLKTKKNSVPLN
jgi:hypothetical protein